jgi:D-psicose/D-tagatose/L-ribulose 3-epimerase
MEPFVRMGGQVGSDIKIWREMNPGADDAQRDLDAKNAVAFQRYMLD